MFVGTLFWVLAQQGGSTISLFIDRFVNRQAFNIEVPTALFQSVNAIAVMLAGVVLAWLASPESRGNSTLRVWLKFAFGLLLMACGFMLLAFDARHAAADGQASMGVMISGLALMGFAELFIDPVAIAQITRLKNVWRINRYFICWQQARSPTGWQASWHSRRQSRKLAVWQLPLTSDSFLRWESGRWLVSRSSWYWPLLPVFCLARRRI